MLKKPAKQPGRRVSGESDRRSHLRPAKNFLGVLGRATRRFSIRKEGLVARAVNKIYHFKPGSPDLDPYTTAQNKQSKK